MYASRSHLWRAGLAMIWLALNSAGLPRQIGFQVTDQRGLPLRDAVVEIARPAGDTRALVFGWRNAMAQRDQTFVPGLLIVPQGATVAFPNLDTVRHSIYSFSRAARFQIDLYGADQSRTHQFAIAGTVALGCHIHDRMKGYLRVTSTPYAARTDINGRALIEGLPAGTYEVTVWHPLANGRDNEWHASLHLTEGAPNRITVETR